MDELLHRVGCVWRPYRKSLRDSMDRLSITSNDTPREPKPTLLFPNFSLILGADPVEADRGIAGRGEGIRLSTGGGPAKLGKEGDSSRVDRTLCSLSRGGTEARSDPSSKYGLDPR